MGKHVDEVSDYVLCVNEEHLRAFHLGKLPEESLLEVHQHLEECDKCTERLESIEAETDEILISLKSSNSSAVSLANASAMASSFQNDHQELGSDHLKITVGDKIDDYEILEELDAGGMGTVYKARHLHMNRIVALKVMDAALTPEAMSRFQREIQTSAQLVHANIVNAFDARLVGLNSMYFVMEYIDGENLSALIKRTGPRAPEEAIQITGEVCKALAYMRRKGLVHRDVKPHNVMIDSDHHVKLLDMGIVRWSDDRTQAQQAGDASSSVELEHPFDDTESASTTSTITSRSMVLGSVAYMSPEQADISADVDHRADIYSLGCTMYFLLTGTPPFAGDSPAEILRSHQDSPIPSVRAQNPSIPVAVDQICQKAMAKRPESRFASHEEMLEALRGASESRFRMDKKFACVLALITLAVLAGAIYQIQTARGTLIIESFDKDVEVSVKDNGDLVTIIDLRTGNRALLRPGSYTLHAKGHADVTLSQESFSLTRDGQQIVKVVQKQEVPQHEISFDATQRQKEFGKNSKLPVNWTNSVGIEFRLIPPGSIKINSGYMATLTRPYYIGKFELTKNQFRKFVEETNYMTVVEKRQTGQIKRVNEQGTFVRENDKTSTWKNPNFVQQGDEPVVLVSWSDARNFATWLTAKEDRVYRLPTHAEWSYAHAAGSPTRDFRFANKAGDLTTYGWFFNNTEARTQPVGQLKPNPFGLYDTFGNVSEYVSDWHTRKTPTGVVRDPLGPISGSFCKISQGGNFCSVAPEISAGAYDPHASMNIFGFRLVCEIDNSDKGFWASISSE